MQYRQKNWGKKTLKCLFNALEEWIKLDASFKFHRKLNVN